MAVNILKNILITPVAGSGLADRRQDKLRCIRIRVYGFISGTKMVSFVLFGFYYRAYGAYSVFIYRFN